MRQIHAPTARALVLMCLAIVQTGCASVATKLVCTKPSDQTLTNRCAKDAARVGGVVYHMPKRPIRLEVVLTEPARLAYAKAKVAASQAAVRAAEGEVDAATSTEADAQAQVDQATTNRAQTDARAALHAAQIDLRTRLAAVARLKRELTADTEFFHAEDKNKPVDMTVTVVDNSATETSADLARSFVLRYRKNYIGENNMAIWVNNQGLLSVSHADTVSRARETAAGIGASAAAVAMGAGAVSTSTPAARTALATSDVKPAAAPDGFYTAPAPNSVTVRSVATKRSEDDKTCAAGAHYSLTVDPAAHFAREALVDTIQVCGVYIDVLRLGRLAADATSTSNPQQLMGESLADTPFSVVEALNWKELGNVPGLYYKQNLPYRVMVCRGECGTASDMRFDLSASSPNESPIYFARIERTLFADNTSDISLVNGVVSGVRENTNSEILGLVDLPSAALNSTTTAASGILSSLQGIAQTENNYISTRTAGSLEGARSGLLLRNCATQVAKLEAAATEEERAAALSAALLACPASPPGD